MADACVRVDPPVIKFVDVKVGQVYKIKVTATNVGKKMKRITFEMPSSKLFKFTLSKSDAMVVPGLHVSGLLEFSPEKDEHVRSALFVHIDSRTIQVPIQTFPLLCYLFMNPVVDFGRVAAASQIVSKRHGIINHGSAPGWFQVQESEDPSIKVTPSDGVVAAGATQWITVELRTDRMREINHDIIVKLQNCSPAILNIRGKVVDTQLMIFDLQGVPLSCLWFGPAYFGTSCEETVVLRNNAPQACDWVCVLQASVSGTEPGTDLQCSTTTDTTLLEKMQNCSLYNPDISQIFMCYPTHGRLEAYGQSTLTLCFSPGCKRSDKEKEGCYSFRKDYSLFLLFESVGSKHGFTHQNGSTGVELAVTGSGFPVSLVPSPSKKFNFPTCVTGESVDLSCVLQNLCPQLPVHFRFHKLPHFSSKPSAGIIAPGQCKNIVISFSPRQQGTFQVLQKIDVLGQIKKQRGSSPSDRFEGLQLCPFHTIVLHLSAVCNSKTTHPLPQLNPGITPLVTNPTGLHPRVQLSDISLCREMVPAAVLNADKTTLHRHRREKSAISGKQEFVALPNDRAESLRPPTPQTQCRTIFTDVPRHCYVDTSYTFTQQEEEKRKKNLQMYADLFNLRRQRRQQKLQQKQQRKIENDVDIGLEPSQGLVPPKLLCKDFDQRSTFFKPWSQNHLNGKDNNMSIKYKITNEVSGLINAVSSISQEMAECNRTLTIQELYQVVIGPLSVDFGEVCVRSVCTQTLEMINHLSSHVWVQLEVDCPELQGSSPVSYVLRPHSQATLTLTFQTFELGEFYRIVPYTVNQKHPGQILVQAQVVPVSLELSTHCLVLHPTSTLLARSGYRSSVTLRNHRNHPAEFTWKPVITDRGIRFSIRPATGVVDAYKELDCEVVWHPAFSSPVEGDFDLSVHEGNKQRLHCVAKVGRTTVQLTEQKKVTFESVPLNMTSVRTAVLRNTGANHAFYQVENVCPIPGMVISPAEGMVPRGGQAILNIHFTTDSVIKFDTRFEIALKGLKSIELRVGGSVEIPNVEISRFSFQLYGVCLGSRSSVPFTLTNHSSAPARVTFNLSEYTDFSVQSTGLSAVLEPGVSVVEIQPKQTVNCSLVFCPTQVASYDFELPMSVNGMVFSRTLSSHSFSSSTFSTSCTLTSGSSKAAILPIPLPVAIATGSRHVEATVIRAPLQMSPDSLHFNITSMSMTYTKTVLLKADYEENMSWSSSVQSDVSWWIDCHAAGMCTIDGDEPVCTVSPSSGRLEAGQSICLDVSIRAERFQRVPGAVTKLTLPLYLGEKRQDKIRDHEEIYRELSITVHPLPHITVHPPQLLLTPVPLGCNMTVTLTVVATGYLSGTHITAEISDVEPESGRKQQPLSLTFPQGTQIPAQDQKQSSTGIIKNETASLTCNVCFCSDTPLTFSSTITFCDDFQNRFLVKVWAVADNCLLTVWPYMALHRSEQQIVLKSGATAVEAVLQNFHIPSVGSFSSISTFGLSSSIKKLSSSDSFPGSTDTSDHSSSEELASYSGGTPTNCGVPEFYASNSELGLFYQSVLVAVERWFSLFGWANGPYPISVPHTVRIVESKIQTNTCKGNTPNEGFRSVVDLLIHLTGKEIPGIPHNQSISHDLSQRTLQLIQQYKAILKFLSVQGACLSYIRPEYLLDKSEFMHWCSLQVKECTNRVDHSSINYESMSKRSWMDLLLQIYKLFILCRVSCKELTCNSTLDKVAPSCLQPEASNIYSPFELQLLSWLNMHYESMRKTVWTADGAPPARWIVNFDLDFTDGLVLAALLAAYCPYLICSHFSRMYTKPTSMEEILHNNIIVVQALTTLSVNIDIYPTDLSDPNPVQMLMLCVHLNKKLPQYQPTQTITLSGELHSTISKQIHLTIPLAKPVTYKALLLGEDAHLFSLPEGSSFTFSAKKSSDLTIQYSCAFLQPKEAALLLVSSSSFGAHGTLAFHLKTCVTHMSPMKTVKCSSPCYQLKSIQLTVTNPFKSNGDFRVKLVDYVNNPLKPEKPNQQPQTACKPIPLVEKMTEGKLSDPHVEEDTEFLCAVKNVFLESGQEHALNIDYLPFSLGSRYCCVLLTCPQIGDIVYMIKTSADLPQPLTLSAKPSEHINSCADACLSVLSLECKVGEVCREVICLPIINIAWEEALAIWGQYTMSEVEYRRRSLTHTLHSSNVRRATALHKLGKQQACLKEPENGIVYNLEVSLPQYFTLPQTVTMPVNECHTIPWANPADYRFVEIPLRFQADSVGTFTCKMVLRSWCDTRVYILEAKVTAQEKAAHLDFTTPVHHSVTQYIPLHNDSDRDLIMKASLCGDDFSGPEVFCVAAGTKACYPLTFHPAIQHIVMGKLTLHNECNGTEHLFTLRGIGQRPLPVDHLLLRCPVGRSTEVNLNVPNYSKTKLALKVETDLSMISGPNSLDIKPGQTAPYKLIISPSKRGTHKGCVSFMEMPKIGKEARYEVYFTLEIICEAAEPLKNINVQCPIQSNVAIEIPINNPSEDQLDLEVFLEGHGLSGDKSFSLPPRKTLSYKVIFSPCVIGKSTGSVAFQSEIGEFWYHLELYALPLPVVVLPEVKCHLGKWTKTTLPLVNPTSEPMELIISNSNPRNYTLEMDSNSLTLQPHSSSQLGVRFSPSCIGERNHKSEITFSCPQLQQWSFSLSGCGLNPECEEPVSISAKMGSSASINIPFTNPTELQAVLHVTLTDEYPHENQNYSGGFTLMSHFKGVQIDAGASIDVPVVFTPTSMKTERARLCISMEFTGNLGISSPSNAHSQRSAQDLSTICWIYPLCGIPTEVPVESPPLGLIRCEAGCQLEKKADVLLAGCGLGNKVTKEDFVCQVHSEHEELKAEESLCAVIETAKKDLDSGVVRLTVNLLYSPLEPSKSQCQASVIVKCVSRGTSWQFPITLIATKPLFDDVIHIEASEVGKTSAVGFRLTSTSRSPEPYTAVFVAGSSIEFTVAPVSGMLPPINSTGALITVSFTPGSNSRRSRARLQIKAADMLWTYEVKGSILHNTPQSAPSQSSASSEHHSIPHSASVNQRNFVVRNHHIPSLANSSPLKIYR